MEELYHCTLSGFDGASFHQDHMHGGHCHCEFCKSGLGEQMCSANVSAPLLSLYALCLPVDRILPVRYWSLLKIVSILLL